MEFVAKTFVSSALARQAIEVRRPLIFSTYAPIACRVVVGHDEDDVTDWRAGLAPRSRQKGRNRQETCGDGSPIAAPWRTGGYACRTRPPALRRARQSWLATPALKRCAARGRLRAPV
jgi:hypothetical protein